MADWNFHGDADAQFLLQHPRCTSEAPLACGEYDRAEAWCRDRIREGADFLFDRHLFECEINDASMKLGIHHQSLLSLLRNIHVHHVKITAPKVRGGISWAATSNSSGAIAQRGFGNTKQGFQDTRNEQVGQKPTSTPQTNVYQAIVGEYQSGTSLHELAKSINFPPYLLCRYVVEHVTSLSGGKKAITAAMRNPIDVLGTTDDVLLPQYRSSEDHHSGIVQQLKEPGGDTSSTKWKGRIDDVSRLALEVQFAIDMDPMYGPRHDRQRHMVGIEYEVVLEQKLAEMNLPFETETDLRERGTSRTPDVVLKVPIAIRVGAPISRSNSSRTISGNQDQREDQRRGLSKASMQRSSEEAQVGEWKLVSWIDSKAMFGDVGTHLTDVVPQAESYVHRFGPGLILYWFGHAPLERLTSSSTTDAVAVAAAAAAAAVADNASWHSQSQTNNHHSRPAGSAASLTSSTQPSVTNPSVAQEEGSEAKVESATQTHHERLQQNGGNASYPNRHQVRNTHDARSSHRWNHEARQKERASKDVIILGWDLPLEFMVPSGEIRTRRSINDIATSWLQRKVAANP